MAEKTKFQASALREMISSCQACDSKDLYLQKDFPRKIAIPIVILGMIAVPFSYGISLIVVALIDFIIFRRTPWMLVCYRCRSEYRGFTHDPKFTEFDRNTGELYDQKL